MITLLRKELAEHGAAVLGLLIGFVCLLLVIQLAIGQQEDSLSSLTVVRFCLLSVFPLVAIILGNRLIVREFLGKTRQFVEALPLHASSQLLVKFLFGFALMLVLTAAAILFAWLSAAPGEDLNPRLLLIASLRTFACIVLLWSITFFVSLCGRLRLLLYLLIGAIAWILATHAPAQIQSIGPFFLLDAQLFAFEREQIPWLPIAHTLLAAMVFIVGSLILVFVREGSITETLAKPLGQRDYVALIFTLVAGLILISVLSDATPRAPYVFRGGAALTHDEFPVTVIFHDSRYRESGLRVQSVLVEALEALQQFVDDQKTSLPNFPMLRFSLDQDKPPYQIDMSQRDGVLIESSFSASDAYNEHFIAMAALHETFQYWTSNRSGFSVNHWVLDGVAGWLSQQAAVPHSRTASSDVHVELLARAAITARRLTGSVDMINRYEWVVEQAGVVSANALSYSAVHFLNQEFGQDPLRRLTNLYLLNAVGPGSWDVPSDRMLSRESAFEQATGVSWPEFSRRWLVWLTLQLDRPSVMRFDSRLLRASYEISADRSPEGVVNLIANSDSAVPGEVGLCKLRHRRGSPFSAALWMSEADFSELPCPVLGATMDSPTRYSDRDRIFAALEWRGDRFHEPMRLWAGHINIGR